MADFELPSGDTMPFGRNEFLRSWQDVKTTSYTFDKDSLEAWSIDGVAGEKVLQPGTVLAKITEAGPKQGKVGPYDATATDGRETAANIVGLAMTFLPYQLRNRDVEVSVVYEASVVKAWCLQVKATATDGVLGRYEAITGGTVTAINTSDRCRFIFN